MKSRLLVVSLAASVIVGIPAALRAQTAPAAAARTVTPVPPAPPDAVTLEKKIDELVGGHMKTNGFGGAVLLAKEGKPLVAKGYGYANIEWQIPNTTTTKFRIGSITKQFTSMLVMQLREQGKIKLEDSMCVYVAPCPEAWKAVTIHHLLTHTSGIPTYTGIPAWREVNMMPKTTDQIIAFFRDLPLQWAPGEKLRLQQLRLLPPGRDHRKDHGQEIRTCAAGDDPHAARSSGYRLRLVEDDSATACGRLFGRRIRPGEHRGARHAAALRGGIDVFNGRRSPQVGSGAVHEHAATGAAKQLMWTPFRENYAYGWMVVEPTATAFGGYRRVLHGGGINGFSAMIVRLPEPRMTVIVLSNNDSASASTVARDIMAIYYGTGTKCRRSRSSSRSIRGSSISSIGQYRTAPGGRLDDLTRGQQPHGPTGRRPESRDPALVRDEVLRDGARADFHLRQGPRWQGHARRRVPRRHGDASEEDRLEHFPVCCRSSHGAVMAAAAGLDPAPPAKRPRKPDLRPLGIRAAAHRAGA